MSAAPAPSLKVCGATREQDVDVLARNGADFVGLWHHVPRGPADLPEHEAAALAAAARATGRLTPVLVTFLNDPDALCGVLRRTGIRTVQLHAYQPPATVRALRARLPDAVVVKVLHVTADGGCVERPLIGAYERAGTDLFLLDAATDDGRIGSTGHRLDEAAAVRLADRLTVPFWLAGGLTPAARPAYDTVVRHPLFHGIDVDTAARDTHGRFADAAVAGLARAWRTAQHTAAPRPSPGGP